MVPFPSFGTMHATKTAWRTRRMADEHDLLEAGRVHVDSVTFADCAQAIVEDSGPGRRPRPGKSTAMAGAAR